MVIVQCMSFKERDNLQGLQVDNYESNSKLLFLPKDICCQVVMCCAKSNNRKKQPLIVHKLSESVRENCNYTKKGNYTPESRWFAFSIKGKVISQGQLKSSSQKAQSPNSKVCKNEGKANKGQHSTTISSRDSTVTMYHHPNLLMEQIQNNGLLKSSFFHNPATKNIL